jgi:hypothetical protein
MLYFQKHYGNLSSKRAKEIMHLVESLRRLLILFGRERKNIMSMRILDLDIIATWWDTYNEFIRNDPFWEVIEDAISQKEDDKIQNILLELDVRIECVKWAEVVSLRNRCNDQLTKNYTHVAAYHACRPTNIESYLSSGILPADTEKLIEKAKELFGDPDAVNKAVKDIGTTYLKHGAGKIGFFESRTGVVEFGYSGYLCYGAELFHGIATRIGDWALKKLSSQGIPTLFRCALPVSWLDDFTTFPISHSYAKAPLEQLLIRLRWPDREDNTITGAFLLKRSVPKENILEAIDMTSSLTEEHGI